MGNSGELDLFKHVSLPYPKDCDFIPLSVHSKIIFKVCTLLWNTKRHINFMFKFLQQFCTKNSNLKICL